MATEAFLDRYQEEETVEALRELLAAVSKMETKISINEGAELFKIVNRGEAAVEQYGITRERWYEENDPYRG